MKRKDYIEKILEIGAVLCFTALILVVSLQVFARFCLPQSPVWTEEASRFLFIYSVAFAAPIALKKNEYVKVDLIVNKLNSKVKIILEAFIYIVLSLFFLTLSYYSLPFAKLGIGQTSPAIGLSMFIPYASILILSFFIGMYSILKILETFKKSRSEKENLMEKEC